MATRRLRLAQASLTLLAADHGVAVHSPLLDPLFVSALARLGGTLGLGDRNRILGRIAVGRLPSALPARRGKAVFTGPSGRGPAAASAPAATVAGSITSSLSLRRCGASGAGPSRPSTPPYSCSRLGWPGAPMTRLISATTSGMTSQARGRRSSQAGRRRARVGWPEPPRPGDASRAAGRSAALARLPGSAPVPPRHPSARTPSPRGSSPGAAARWGVFGAGLTRAARDVIRDTEPFGSVVTQVDAADPAASRHQSRMINVSSVTIGTPTA